MWYSVFDIERIFGVPPLATLAAIDAGQIRARLVRGCWQVRPGDFARWWESRFSQSA